MRVFWAFWGVPLTVSFAPKLYVHISKERLFVFFDCGVELEASSEKQPPSAHVLFNSPIPYHLLYVYVGFSGFVLWN
jgi:hypothetical protein